jgi:hypothetical protein
MVGGGGTYGLAALERRRPMPAKGTSAMVSSAETTMPPSAPVALTSGPARARPTGGVASKAPAAHSVMTGCCSSGVSRDWT